MNEERETINLDDKQKSNGPEKGWVFVDDGDTKRLKK